MSDEENESVPMAECGACRTVIPLDSTECPECQTKFSGVSDEALGECGACNQLVPLDSTRCPECGVVFVADDVVDILRTWVHSTGINIRKLFDKFDENSDGSIDASELRAGLLSLNLADLPPSQVDRLVNEIDADENGVIDLDEFETILMGDEPMADPVATSIEEPAEEDEQASDESDEVVVDTTEDIQDEPEEDESSDETEENEAGDEPVEEVVEAEETDHGEEVEESHEDNETVPESDESDMEDDGGIDDEAFDLDEEDEEASEEEKPHPLQALADMMDEQEISAQRMFNELDVDGNGMISSVELMTTLTEKYGDVLDIDDVDAIMNGVDSDGDGMIDITEFFESMESLDDHDEVVETEAPEKEFPTIWQKRMMSKAWNDSVWPIIHVGFGLIIVAMLVNGMLGPVDGSGGTIVYEANERVPPINLGLVEGDLYPCDESYQLGGCKNSLTPFAGENGASSMPKGFYWDGLLLMFLGVLGISASLFLHLVKAPGWRARAKAMKEVADDKADAAEVAHDSEDESDEEEELDEATEEEADAEEVEEEQNEEYEDEEDGEEAEDDDIDIGSHIGLVLEDEEVFGTILEFDDDEGTVTIEEDGTGDLVTGYQEDMFIE